MNSPVITLERTACFGTCPVYGLNLFEDGTVVYIGVDHVAVTGVQVTKIDPSIVQSLVDQMKASSYFGWNDEYTKQIITDQPTVITSLSTVLQTRLDNSNRGRVMALWIMGFGGTVPIGAWALGLVASATSITVVLWIGAAVALALVFYSRLDEPVAPAPSR